MPTNRKRQIRKPVKSDLPQWKLDWLYHGKKPDRESGFLLKWMLWRDCEKSDLHAGIYGPGPETLCKTNKRALIEAFKRENPTGKPFHPGLL